MSFGQRHKKLTRDSIFSPSLWHPYSFLTVLFAGLLYITGFKFSVVPSASLKLAKFRLKGFPSDGNEIFDTRAEIRRGKSFHGLMQKSLEREMVKKRVKTF